MGALARSPAVELTGRSAGRSGGATAVAAGAGAASEVGAPQRPSAPTSSSGPTGPRGLSWTFLPLTVELAQLGLANRSTGLENQPPSLASENDCSELVQPVTAPANPAAHKTSAILELTR